MSEKVFEAKWKGSGNQKVPGVGLFIPGEVKELNERQASLLAGVNDPLYEIKEKKEKPDKGKEK